MKKLLHFKYKQALLLCLFLISSMSWGQETWNKLTNHTDVTNSGTYLIVDVTSQTALSSSNGTASAPTAVDLSGNINGDSISGAIATNLRWTFEESGTNYIIRPSDNATNSLYSTSKNNGVRVGANASNTWMLQTVIGDYKGFKHVGTSRYLGVYNEADWRGYTTAGGNIAYTQIEIFELVVDANPTITTSATSINDLSYIAGNGPSDVQTFILSGTNLDGTNQVVLDLDQLSDFEVSADGITFGPEVTLPDYDGTGSTISVRLKAGKAVATYTDAITISGYSVTATPVTLSGKVTAPPSIPVVTADNLTGTFGQAFSHQVVASETPDSYAISGALPNGITLNTITGLISGTPTQAGIYTADITATNISGTSAEALFNFEIAKATQTLSSFVDLNKYDTDIPFVLPENSDAGIAVVYTSSNSNVATVSGNTVSITGIGSTTLTASNSGNSNYELFSKSVELVVTEVPAGPCGLEDFTTATLTTSYADGSFAGNNGITWSYVGSRDENGDDNGSGISGNAIMLRRVADNSAISSSTISTGIGDFSVKLYKGFTGGGDRQVELFINGVSYGTSTAFDDNNEHIFEIENINISGDFTIEIKNSTSKQIIIDDITWTCYAPILSTTYENGAWTNGEPTATIDAIINADFTTGTTDLNAKSLTVTSGVFTVSTGTTLTVANAIVNNAGAANFIVENDAVVLQGSDVANTGAVIVKRNSADLYRQDYTLWSSPVTGQNLRAFSEETIFSRFYSYDTAATTTEGWGAYVQEIVTTTDMDSKIFNVGQGYLIRMPNSWTPYADNAVPGTPYQGSFEGTLNNGDYTFPLVNANTNMNLVGNPYPSPISISSFFAANPAIAQNLYFWRKRNGVNQASGYATYSGLGVTSAQPVTEDDFNYINPGQGYFVDANVATSLTFNNGMRTAAGGPVFFKTANETTTESHRFWLNLSNATDVLTQTLVGYTTDATSGVDNGIDAVYFNDSALALTSLINDTEYAIQGRSLPFVDTDIVPLGFKSDVAGSFSISLASFDGLFDGDQGIFLKDNSTGALHNLKTNAYLFTTEVGVFNSRFEVYYNSTLSTSNPVFDTDAILIGVKNQQITINAGSMVIDKVELIDVSGRIIYTTAGVNATIAVIDSLTVSNQMLIVRISTSNDKVINQKIIF